MKTLEEIMNEPAPPFKNNLTPGDIVHIENLMHRTICTKCNGTGIIPEYGHVKNGKCFACNGKGKV